VARVMAGTARRAMRFLKKCGLEFTRGLHLLKSITGYSFVHLLLPLAGAFETMGEGL
jgi:hypothetical protein